MFMFRTEIEIRKAIDTSVKQSFVSETINKMNKLSPRLTNEE